MAQENMSEEAVLGAVAGIGGVAGAAVLAYQAADAAIGKMLASASSQKFEVDKDTVLQAGKIIRDEAQKLRVALRHAYQQLSVHVDDDVNRPIAEAWNARLVEGQESYAGRIDQYITSLNNLAEQLRETATQYGFTEDEVKAAFGAKSGQ